MTHSITAVNERPRFNECSRRVLVTGGCGFVGRHLVKRLLQDKDNFVFMVDNLAPEGGGAIPDGWLNQAELEHCAFYHMSMEQFFLHVDTHFIHDYDQVYHLAAIIGGRLKIDNDPLLVAKDLAIDATFFNWLRLNKGRIGHVQYASSSAVYPVYMQNDIKNHGYPISESAVDIMPLHQPPRQFGVPDMTYGWAKLTGEYLARIAHEKYGVNISVVRPFSGYGEDQDLVYPVPAIAKRVARGDTNIEIWGTGRQVRDFVYIEDCIDCMILATEKITNGEAINISSGKGTSFIELGNMLVQARDNSLEVRGTFHIDERKPMGVLYRVGSNKKAKTMLNWYPKTSLEQGLRLVLENWQKKGVTASVPQRH